MLGEALTLRLNQIKASLLIRLNSDFCDNLSPIALVYCTSAESRYKPHRKSTNTAATHRMIWQILLKYLDRMLWTSQLSRRLRTRCTGLSASPTCACSFSVRFSKTQMFNVGSKVPIAKQQWYLVLNTESRDPVID